MAPPLSAPMSLRGVIFKLFHSATHFATQFNLAILFQKFPVGICNAVVFVQQKMTMSNVQQRPN